MRICILGAGGLGSVVGGYLALGGQDVTLIGRPAHVDAIGRQGLRISGRLGEFLVRHNLAAVASAEEAEGHFDYLILLVKSKDTQSALSSADNLRERIDTVMSLQNDPYRAENLARWVNPDKVIGSVTVEGGTLIEPGHAYNHVTSTITAYFGELDGSVSRRCQDIALAFSNAGLNSDAVPDIHQVIWEKLLLVGCAAGWSISTLPGIPSLVFSDGLLVREGAAHYVQISKELLSVYKAMGYSPKNYFAPFSRLNELDSVSFDEAVDFAMELGRNMEVNNIRSRPSMLDDILRGRKTEAEEIFGPFLGKASKHGLEVPTIQAVYRIATVLNHYLEG